MCNLRVAGFGIAPKSQGYEPRELTITLPRKIIMFVTTIPLIIYNYTYI